MGGWISVEDRLPDNGDEVRTKIDDADGCRNDQRLVRKDTLWFLRASPMYVYFSPTHWMPLPDPPVAN